MNTPSPQSSSSDDPPPDLRIGVIGAGGRGRLARLAHQPGEGSRVVACLDINESVLADAREWYGPDLLTTDDLDAFLASDIDAVFVSTPDYLHVEHAVPALKAGKAVFLEKPLATTVELCDEILQTAAASGARLYVGHNMRHMIVVTKMKELIDAGAIGEVKTAWVRHFVGHGGDYFFKDWHADRRNVNGLLIQKAAHDIDVIHWLCGASARRVNAMGSLMVYGDVSARAESVPAMRPESSLANWPPLAQRDLAPHIDIEDVSMLNMELDNGVLASYQQCMFTPDYWRSYTIIGTEGRIENIGDVGQGATVNVWNTRREGYGPPDEVYDVSPDPENDDDHGGADGRIVDEFIRFARDGAPATTSPVSARDAVAAGDAATRSLRSGGIAIDVPRIDPEVAGYFTAQTV